MSSENVKIRVQVIDTNYLLSEQNVYVVTNLPLRVIKKIKFDPNGCWIWTGSSGFHPKYRHHRYGQITIWNPETKTKKRTTSHRFTYECEKGPIPYGYEVDHICRNKLCVNPEHLRAITLQENRQNRIRIYRRAQ